MTLQKFKEQSSITEITEFSFLEKITHRTDSTIPKNNFEKMSYMLERISHACAHELKEPLRNSANFLHLLSHKNSQKFDKETLNHLKYLHQNITRMDTLIRDVSLYLAIENQQNQTKTIIDTNKTIDDIIKSFKNRFSENNTRFTISTLPNILGVRLHIHKLFFNLIDNALKFRSQKPLHLKIFVVNQVNFIEFHVSDNGIGIEREYHDHIFNMFSRLHPKDLYAGSGMGLALCKEITQKHAGEIKVESKVGFGSEFIIKLPKKIVNSYLAA